MNQVVLVTGPDRAGRAAVAEAICERFDRMLHVEVEELRRLVKAGYRHQGTPGDTQAIEQRLLAILNASAIARESIALRYAVVIDDVILAEDADSYREALRGADCNVHFVALLPKPEAMTTGNRSANAELSDHVTASYDDFEREIAEGLLPGVAIHQAHDENARLTADRVLDAVSSGEALFIKQKSV